MEIEIGKTYFVKEWKFNIRIVGELKDFVFYAFFDNHHNVVVEYSKAEEIKELISPAEYDEFEDEDYIFEDVENWHNCITLALKYIGK